MPPIKVGGVRLLFLLLFHILKGNMEKGREAP